MTGESVRQPSPDRVRTWSTSAWLSQRRAVLAFLGAECVLLWVGSAWVLNNLATTAVTGPAFVFLAPTITALLILYWRGWDRARYVVVVLHTLAIGTRMPLPSEHFDYIPQMFMYPTVIALLMAGPAWVIGSALGTAAILLYRVGGFTPYLTPGHFLAATVLVACLVVSRLVIDAARREAETRAEQAERALAELQCEADERQRQQEELDLQATMLRAVQQPVIATDPRGSVIYWNRAAEEQLGWKADDLLGRRMTDVEPPPFDLPADDAWWAKVTAEDAPTLEYTGRRRSGAVFPVSVSSWPIRDADGVLRGRVAVITDLTEQREVERQRELFERGDKLRALGQMAGGIAHDLNQALAVVTGYVELAVDNLRTRPDHEETSAYLKTATQAAMQGADSVKRLLTFARQQDQGPPEVVDISQVIADTVHFTAPQWRDRAQAEGRPIQVEVQAEAGLRTHGWMTSLREAFMNLVLNAVDALPEGGSVCITARRAAGQILIEVADSGTGMPEAVRSRIFEPFFTTKGEQGTGLGLAMVFGIVERHGGEITVSSAQGEGTTFTIRLSETAAGAITTEPTTPVTTALPARLLVVDDDPRLARMLTAMLVRDGHEVETASSGEAAVSRLAAGGYGVAISDLSMGAGMNGWELAEHVAGQYPDTRFVLASGWGSGIGEREARGHAVDAVLARPYHLDQVRTLIGRLTA